MGRAETTAREEPAGFHIAPHRGVPGPGAQFGVLPDQRGQVVRVELVAPVGMLQVLRGEGRAQRRAQRGMGSLVGADFTPENFHRVAFLAAGGMVPPFEGRAAELNGLARDRMAPGAGGQFPQLVLEFAPRRRGGQERPDDAEAEIGPALRGTGDGRIVFHETSFFCFSTGSAAGGMLTTTRFMMSPGILCGTLGGPHRTRPRQAAGEVIGARNLSKSRRRSRRSAPKRTHKDQGSVASHRSGRNRARASFQNEL